MDSEEVDCLIPPEYIVHSGEYCPSITCVFKHETSKKCTHKCPHFIKKHRLINGESYIYWQCKSYHDKSDLNYTNIILDNVTCKWKRLLIISEFLNFDLTVTNFINIKLKPDLNYATYKTLKHFKRVL